jgi:hypothetical protein
MNILNIVYYKYMIILYEKKNLYLFYFNFCLEENEKNEN